MKILFLTLLITFSYQTLAAKNSPSKSPTSRQTKTPSSVELQVELKAMVTRIADSIDPKIEDSVNEDLFHTAIHATLFLWNKNDPEIYYALESLALLEATNKKLFTKIWIPLEHKDKKKIEKEIQKAKENLDKGHS